MFDMPTLVAALFATAALLILGWAWALAEYLLDLRRDQILIFNDTDRRLRPVEGRSLSTERAIRLIMAGACASPWWLAAHVAASSSTAVSQIDAQNITFGLFALGFVTLLSYGCLAVSRIFLLAKVDREWTKLQSTQHRAQTQTR